MMKIVMNVCIKELGRDIFINQSVLHASIKKGNRPSKPEIAIPLYEKKYCSIRKDWVKRIETGILVQI